MAEPCIVLIAAADLLPALRDRLGAGDRLLPFADTQPLEALEAITRERPRLVALERLFAASPRGAALMARIKADPALRDSEIRVVSHDGAYSRVSPRRAAAAPPPTGRLDTTGTRRATRFRMRPRVMVLVDGNPATLVDLSVAGAQLVSPSVVRPNQRVKLTFRDDDTTHTVSATVVWAKFELTKGSPGPAYRAGVEFTSADAGPVEAYCERHRAEDADR